MGPARALSIAAIVYFGVSTLASAGSPISERVADRFVLQLHHACVQDDRRAIADVIQYPLTVSVSGLSIPVPDRRTFLKYYDVFLTDEVRASIATAAASVRKRGGSDQRALTLSATSIVIGRNVVRASQVGNQVKIVSISLPSLNRGWRAARPETQRILFRAGEPPARFAGALARGERESYVVTLRGGQLLDVRVDEVRGRDVVAHVLDTRSGVPIDSRAREGVRVWSGRVAASGDYRIEIVRVANSLQAVLTYLLTIDVR